MSPLGKAPFLYLLIPLLGGICLQYYCQNITLSIIFSLLGGLIMLFSFFNKRKSGSYNSRWLFGLAIIFLMIGIGGERTFLKQKKLNYTLIDSTAFYIGYITDTPQEKPQSVAHKIHLLEEGVDIVCYLTKDSTRSPLEVGDEIAFIAHLQPFRNMGNPDDFDYETYMYNQGFVGSAYLSKASWLKTGNNHHSLRTLALRVRQKIMDFYSSLGFSIEEKSVLSALTLGYQESLSDDLKQAFRTTGTVHVLSVSGLHVGIIYGVIAFLLSFISTTSRLSRIRPVLIITLLWIYAFITGLPPSVVRASIMLSLFCLSEMVGRQNSPLNTLSIAAFVMLLYNPFWFLDIGFQLSFLSVLSIIVLYKPMTSLFSSKNKLLKIIWQLFSISVVTQIATFPLCLYYFGTFPTYFFLANLIVVPLVTLIIYAMGFLVLAWVMTFIIPQYESILYWLPIKIEQTLVSVMMRFVYLFEGLPFALIENIDISLFQLFLIIGVLVCILFALNRGNTKSLIFSLTFMVVLLISNIYEKMDAAANRLIVYNRNAQTDIRVVVEGREGSLNESIQEKSNPVFQFDDKTVLFVDSIFNSNLYTKEKYKVDYVVIINTEYYMSLSFLERYYEMSNVVLDGSLTAYTRTRLTKECEKKRIPLHDVTKDGAFTIFFTTFAH